MQKSVLFAIVLLKWGHAKVGIPWTIIGLAEGKNMTEWSASNQRHWPVNPQLSFNYNINLQLSRGIYIE